VSKEEFIDNVAIEIEPGAVTYMGSYKVTGIDRNLLKSDTFDIQASETPSRNTILTHLQTAAKGTGWDQRFASAMNDK
jgi:hypothetical protein